MIRKGILMVVGLAVLMLTACQITPEALIVQSKAGGELKEAIAVESTGVKDETDIGVAHIAQEVLSNDGITRIVIDADVLIPAVDQMPVAKLEKDYFSQEQIETFIDVLFKGEPLYDLGVVTKDELEWLIVHIEKSALDLNSDLAQSNGIDNLVDLRELADERIAMYQEQLKDAADEKPVIDGVDASAEHWNNVGGYAGKDEMANIFYTRGDVFHRFEFRNFGDAIDPQGLYMQWREYIHPVDFKDDTTGFKTGREAAETLIKDMNISDMVLKKAYIYDEIEPFDLDSAQDINIKANGTQYHVFCFFREINGMVIDNAFYRGTTTEDDSYERPWPYEQLEVWTDTDGAVVQFLWESPAKVAHIENDNVQIQIDAEQAISLLGNQGYIRYSSLMGEKSKSVLVRIDRIELALARIKEKDTGEYLVLPVWDFYGEVFADVDLPEEAAVKFPKEGEYYNVTAQSAYESLVTINALDGSFIDRQLGY